MDYNYNDEVMVPSVVTLSDNYTAAIIHIHYYNTDMIIDYKLLWLAQNILRTLSVGITVGIYLKADVPQQTFARQKRTSASETLAFMYLINSKFLYVRKCHNTL